MPLDTGGQVRFMAENLLTTGYNALTSSAINPSYPITNLTSKFRGRPAKFAGTFIIDATNLNLYINDGADKTAVVATGTYTSRTTFATAIQTALNAVSSTFIVTWNSVTHCFVINHTGAFTLRLSVSTNAIHNTIGFTGVTDLTLGSVYSGDQKRFHWPYEWVKVDFGYAPNIGFLGIVSDSRYVFSLTENATVKVQANTIDDFTAPPVDLTLVLTTKGILKFFDDDEYSYRYWRITIIDNTSTDDATLGYVYLGEFHKFGDDTVDDRRYRYNAQGATNYTEDRSEKSVSESGQVYALEKQLQKCYDDIAIQMMDPDNRDMLDDIWSRFKTVHPFFISIDPKLEISNNLTDFTFLCTFNEKPEYNHQSGNKFNTSFGVKEWL